MQRLIVAKKEMKPTTKGGMMVALFDEKGTRFSGFLPELKDVVEGDTVELDIQVDGKYLNIVGVKVLSHGFAPDKPPAARVYGQDSPEKRRSIERQTAAQIVFRDFPKPAGLVEGLHLAEAIYQWISAGTIPTASKPPAESKDTTGKPSVPPAPKPTSKPSPSILTPQEKLAEALKCETGAQLCAFAGKHGISVADFQKAVGVPTQVKDVQAAAKVLFPVDAEDPEDIPY